MPKQIRTCPVCDKRFEHVKAEVAVRQLAAHWHTAHAAIAPVLSRSVERRIALQRAAS